MSDETTLLPCPFCGGEAELVEGEYGMYLTGYAIYCKGTCGAKLGVTGRLCEAYEWTPYFDTEAEAIAAWNARAEHGTLTAEQVMAIAGRHQPDYCSDTHVCFNWQAIADELNGLGSGTCEFNVVEEFIPGKRQRWNICECSNCGFILDERFKCCPNCGQAD